MPGFNPGSPSPHSKDYIHRALIVVPARAKHHQYIPHLIQHLQEANTTVTLTNELTQAWSG